MKTAVYIDDGVVQIVLTPETDFEKSLISGAAKKNVSASIFHGGFYKCEGGWDRFGFYTEESLMIRVSENVQVDYGNPEATPQGVPHD